MAGPWTEIRAAMPAIQATGEDYDVYAVTDASGGVSVEAHEMAVRRMIKAGVTPLNWLAVVAERQRDRAREETVPGRAEILVRHGGAGGIAFAWETQLLAGRTGNGA
ncbi:isochorismatase family protein [Nocardiopsis sp. CC223A]|uniref:isochorismatase family protein n=1 Tax=Nocardiopsis sp. CC223A TaxID=3044051 RepID=UPI00278BDACE|nr:isochorismatase family protein [Nocardiopsis sp. CC223A]